jgi:hypothetical protein
LIYFFQRIGTKAGYQQNERTGPIPQAPSSKLSKVNYLLKKKTPGKATREKGWKFKQKTTPQYAKTNDGEPCEEKSSNPGLKPIASNMKQVVQGDG